MKPKLAIIGAGLSGLVLAKELSHEFTVTVFEKARGVGGRMSTRYSDSFFFDHGTQAFTAETQSFKNFLEPYIKSSLITEWTGRVVNLKYNYIPSERLWKIPHYVSSPNMNSLCKELAKGLNMKLNTEVALLSEKINGAWYLKDTNQVFLGEFDWIISTAPPEQTSNLFQNYISENNKISNSKMSSCFALMVGFNRPWDQNWIAAKTFNSPLKWISINSTKIGRPKQNTCFVAQSRGTWSYAHRNNTIQEVENELVKEFEKITSISCKNADFITTHHWKYAIVKKTNKSGYYLDLNNKLAATSDWCSTSRIEEVWHSAQALILELRK
jgi:renalase